MALLAGKYLLKNRPEYTFRRMFGSYYVYYKGQYLTRTTTQRQARNVVRNHITKGTILTTGRE